MKNPRMIAHSWGFLLSSVRAMSTSHLSSLLKNGFGCVIALLAVLVPCSGHGAGITLITHGFELGGYPTWVSAMADQMPSYFQGRYPNADTNFATYRLTVSHGGSGYLFTSSRANGTSPFTNGTGEIVIELDWSSLSGDVFDSYANTYNVGWAVAQILMLTNAVAELNGHALVEFPIHLIGHSRGGSLISQIAYVLGTNGVWVDQLTTLDPYPINNDGNFDFPASITDAPTKNTYVNVVYADNYWQNLGPGYFFGDPDGEPVAGAYVRQLSNLSGGYGNDHPNVHLWYHGTVKLTTPASDSGATITATERANWWVPYESAGAMTGFYYSLIGGGDRLSTAMPLGLPGDPKIVDGYNQNWDLGAGSAPNRTALPSNSGLWPDLIKFDVTGTNRVVAGGLFSAKLYYQYGGSSNLTATIFLDTDFNPYNSNSVAAVSFQPTNTGTGSVFTYPNLALATTNAPPGIYAVYAMITDGARTRYLYAPELMEVISALQPPFLNISELNSSQFQLSIQGVSGQTIVLQISSDLQTWLPVATNTLPTGLWIYTNAVPPGSSQRFYRAVVGP